MDVLLTALAFVVIFVIVLLARLAVADADLKLLSKGPHKPDAFLGKVVWITGASQGLGAELAIHFARNGARLILSGRNTDRLQAVKAMCLEVSPLTGTGAAAGHSNSRAKIDTVVLLPFDVCGPYSALEKAAAEADAAFGGERGVDYLIHNAGASQHALAAATSHEVVEALFAVNALGPIKLTRAALPSMLRRGKGRIVVVASMAGRVPSPGQAAYSGAKFALFGYFASLATELANGPVGVTICCPGPVAANGDGSRMVWGPTSMVAAPPSSTNKKVPMQRCAQLIANAAAHGMDEVWIARQPVLGVGYLFQLVPRLGWAVLKKVGPKRARALSEGRSGYDVGSMLASKEQ